MKLQSLTIEGFWGYRESARVDIAGLPLLVAVGHNGSGKSALVVSAVLAGLYGKFPTRTVEESITVGATTGTIIIEFEVGGAVYRVARAHPRSGDATASVHRRVDGDWEAVTGKGVREATAKVTELLGMGYETAVMTWVAEQGQYGAFANALPAARFKMLASVFDLGKYGPMNRAAQERLRGAKDDVATAQGRVQELNDNLIDDDARDDNTMTDAALATAAAAAHTAVDAAAAALAAHQQSDPQVAVARARTSLDAVRGARLERLAAAEQVLNDARAARDQAPVRRDEQIGAAQARFDRDTAAVKARAAATIGAAEGSAASAERELEVLTAAAATVPTLHAADQKHDADSAAARQAVETTRAAVTGAELVLDRAQRAHRAAQAKVAEAVDTLEALAHAGDCYACGQHITEQVAANLRAAQQLVVDAQEAEVADAAESVSAATAELDDVRATHEQARRAANDIDVEWGRTRRALADAERAAADAGRARDTLAREQESAGRLRTELDETLARLATDRDETITRVNAEHDEALAVIAERGKTAAAAVNAARKPAADEEQLARDLADAEALAAAATDHAAATARLTAARDAARAEAASLAEEIGRRAEVARRQAEQGARIRSAKKDLAAAEEAVRIHTDLVAAYSPSGIPSMVLESVIGELNAAINVTLAELSGGELEVRLTTARETSGGTTESKVTVYVDTPTGARAYEALSGGQRFRVDLAIRTGLAAIVARGTGTPVETFILDEGWGSLDEAGIRSTLEVLGRLSETVNVVSVSHVDSVRDAFPARIEVTTNEGTAHAVVVR